ncbi:hypothetical protein Vafri_16189 [Volvox africanus]|nr:hypothetical protein Vafri_16189 [Volvox africanus]
MPVRWQSSLAKADVNHTSRSVTRVLGKPWCFHTCSVKRCATSSAVQEVVVGAKWTILDRRSTKTIMASWFLRVLGSWVMRSMLTLSHRLPGIGRGSSRPCGCLLEGLLRWQSPHDVT